MSILYGNKRPESMRRRKLMDDGYRLAQRELRRRRAARKRRRGWA